MKVFRVSFMGYSQHVKAVDKSNAKDKVINDLYKTVPSFPIAPFLGTIKVYEC